MLTPTSAAFPVKWQDPSDANYHWMFERMHAPEPMTLADGVTFQCAFDHGVTFAAGLYGVPLRAMTRRINTYLYLALVPSDAPSPSGQARLFEAIGRLKELWEHDCLPEIKRHLLHWEALDPASATVAELVEQMDDSLARTRRLYEIHFVVWFPFMAAISLFDDFYAELFGRESEFDSFRLLQGFENKTIEGGQALWQLSRQALASGTVRSALVDQPADTVIATLEETSEGRFFAHQLRQYLDAWGQRGDRWGWSFPSWIEDPTPVIRTLQDYVRQPDRDLEAEMAAQVAVRKQLVAEARARLRSHPAEVRERFEFLLDAAQTAIVLTEDHSHWIDFRCMYHLHRVSLELGRRMADAGVLDRPEDVFMLDVEELRETAYELPGLNRRALVAARRAEMEHFRSVSVPPTLGTPPSEGGASDPVSMALAKFFGTVVTESPTDGVVIRGNRGSPGKAIGRARVIRSLAAAGKLEPGDVLVAPTTAPPWTPLFATASAVVTDTGGILSHCAVVAREYGIPAVVGTGKATAMLRDGQLLEVDGDAGTVRVLPGGVVGRA